MLGGVQRLFFKRQAEFAQRVVHQPVAGRDLVCLGKPKAQFGKSGIRPRLHLGLDRIVKPGELWLNMASLRAGRSFTRLSPATENLGNVRDADAQGRGNFPNELSGIGVSQHTIAKVLRIGHAAPPRHLHLRSIQPETFESHP